MKIIIIGLGNFGANLGLKFMEDDHEVFGIDSDISLVNKYSAYFTATMCLDTTDEESFKQIPLKDTDIVIIAIGEDVGASLTTIALTRKYFQKRIIARSINEVHYNIVKAMNVDDIVQPEVEYANELSNRLLIPNAIKSMDLPDDYEILELKTPPKLVGKNIKELDAKHQFDVYILTVIKKDYSKNFLGNTTEKHHVQGILPPDYVIEENDILLLFGNSKKVFQFVHHFS